MGEDQGGEGKEGEVSFNPLVSISQLNSGVRCMNHADVRSMHCASLSGIVGGRREFLKMLAYGCVCSGIGAATVAWAPLGWKPAWFSEILPFPSAVLAHHYPETPNLGDMTNADWIH